MPIVLGDEGVGKSSLIQRFVEDTFKPSIIETIGVEFLQKDLEVDGRKYTLQVWDTTGKERFKTLRTPFYRGKECCLLTYAINDTQSFQNLAMWKKEFLQYADVKDPENFPFVVLGNKSDLESERKVSKDEAIMWCFQNGNLPHYEISAKDAVNVELAFSASIRHGAAPNVIQQDGKDGAVSLDKMEALQKELEQTKAKLKDCEISLCQKDVIIASLQKECSALKREKEDRHPS